MSGAHGEDSALGPLFLFLFSYMKYIFIFIHEVYFYFHTRGNMKIGDLVEFNEYDALVIDVDSYTGEILIKWCDDGEVSDAANYPELEVISESG